ncbi:nucleoside deaminase [Micromonospora sp. KLBMP9576]|uniref:nucleoside deaminase n=1 Tax=Micromonospora sp. KLBMP9576 TaxID=3424769 RepID=UPI003D8C0142
MQSPVDSLVVTAEERQWLDLAVELAVCNIGAGGGPFGAVVVSDGAVVGQGGNRVTAFRDPTAHAEVMAIRAACRTVNDFRLDGAVLLSSCEPCPMCLTAALWARIDRVLYAADRYDAAEAGFDDLRFYELLDRPSAQWDMPVTRLPSEGAGRPFRTWSNRSDRIPY